jgi:DUF971 family protein
MSAPNPTDILLHRQSRILEIAFDDGARYELPCEFLRVHSPSAEVRGHGPGQEVLQTGKQDVAITEIRAVGNYGICPVFSDGHDSGIFTWAYLHELGANRERMWGDYLRKLEEAGFQRTAFERDHE